MKEPQDKENDNNHRLGIDNSIPDVDKRLIKPFAKITRLIGIAIVAAFVLWGVFSEWDYYRSPFEAFGLLLDVPRNDTEIFQLFLVAAIMTCGWFARFTIGNIFVVIAFKITDFIKSIFRLI